MLSFFRCCAHVRAPPTTRASVSPHLSRRSSFAAPNSYFGRRFCRSTNADPITLFADMFGTPLFPRFPMLLVQPRSAPSPADAYWPEPIALFRPNRCRLPKPFGWTLPLRGTFPVPRLIINFLFTTLRILRRDETAERFPCFPPVLCLWLSIRFSFLLPHPF